MSITPDPTYSVKSTLFPIISMSRLEGILRTDRNTLKAASGTAGSHYDPFDTITQKKSRHIDNPRTIKALQKVISERLLKTVPFPSTMIGGINGRSPKEIQRFHINKPCVVTLDIKNNFPSIDPKRVYDIFIQVYGCSAKIAALLTRLTTYQYHLPQGAPTSTPISNLALLPVHDDILKYLAGTDIAMSMCCDDVQLSGKNPNEHIGAIIDIIIKHGFAVKGRKVKIMPHNKPQEVLGYIVNKKLSKPGHYVRALRERIIKIGKMDVIPEYELRSIDAKIAHLRDVGYGRVLQVEALACHLLPDHGVEMGKKPKNYIIKDCKGLKYCEREKRRKEPQHN